MAAVHGSHAPLAEIQTDHPESRRRKSNGVWQANISEADDADRSFFVDYFVVEVHVL